MACANIDKGSNTLFYVYNVRQSSLRIFEKLTRRFKKLYGLTINSEIIELIGSIIDNCFSR